MKIRQITFALFTLGIVGCSFLASSLGGDAPSVAGTNPLGGTPLTLPSAQLDSNTCDRSVGEPQLLLSASDAEICIVEAVMVPMPVGAPFPGLTKVARQIDGDAGVQTIVLEPTAPAKNVARCTGVDGEHVWWQQDFRGCIANDDSITPSTSLLGLHRNDDQVDGARPATAPPEHARFMVWKFAAPPN